MSFEPIISIHGRWSFLIDSETRPGMRHLVDLEPELDIDGNPAHGGEPWKCSCEAHQFDVTRPCKHVKEIIRWLGPVFQYIAAFDLKNPSRNLRGGQKSYQLDPHKKYDPTAANKTKPKR